ncbi:MAG TPA: tRNA preQ1(34) S-adenosylmethionine ribosyltransferase-isomerase QueA [Bacilli bacterium]|nr:tRNA preQ1(34) S-adenosylmethionine ribosyltransferase-isomerase QueA [Bacilli bacterium]
MNIEEFDFELDESLIAQTPLEHRDDSRLMVVDKKSGNIYHKMFKDIINYMNKGDALVLNDTKVIPARLIGEKTDTGAVIEILLLKDLGNDTWESLVKPAKRVKIGTIISFGEGILNAKCMKVLSDGICYFKLTYSGILLEILDTLGTMPLPPYIHEKLDDQSRYQTVYAKVLGSAAAPTAGLHFTPEILQKIKDKGVNIVYITLHVGLGTFRPVKEANILDHKMHSEFYMMSEETAELLSDTKARGKRIISVGTTVTRTLETIMNKHNKFIRCSGDTDIFIYPGYKFRGIDMQITNFHLPKSTLIMLVSAFATKDIIMKAYREAVKERYRFFSFGDSMLIGDVNNEN